MTKQDKWFYATLAGLVLASLMACLSLTGCASGLDGAKQALSSAERVQTASIHAMEHYDVDHQADIIATAQTLEGGNKALLAYRIQRANVVKVILDAAAVTSVGATLIPLVEHGQKSPKDLDGWLVDLLAAGLKVKDALAAFGVKL